jgi:ligand-binding SRPBCC domain-containing protein
MLPLFQLGLGARMGSGNQWMSWIHNDDLARLILRLLEGASHEIFNATAPHPVTNAELTSTLARQLKRPAFFRIPGGVLKLALGEMADALLASAKAVPRNALDIGFSFRHPTLGEALSEILGDGCRVLTREQWVPRPREEVFAFFAEAGNLERITPPLVRFRIDPPAPISMGKGTVISYRLGLHGIPFRWVSRIDEWDPPRTFVDLQVRGPYRYWRHRHDFEEKDGGTLLRDTVRYRLPLEPFSRLLVGGRIEKDLTEIFSYRRRAVEELFGGR